MGLFSVVKKTKEATVLKSSKTGKQFALLTPSGKCKRYEREIASGRNSRTGEKLNDVAVGYRMGYRSALGEQAKIYNKKNKR